MEGDRFFYLMVVVIALIGIGLFAIPVMAHGASLTQPAKPPAIHWLRIPPTQSCSQLLHSGPSISGMRRV